jgi:hypothetical protein
MRRGVGATGHFRFGEVVSDAKLVRYQRFGLRDVDPANCTVGSNPTLSATPFRLGCRTGRNTPRNPAVFAQACTRETCGE